MPRALALLLALALLPACDAPPPDDDAAADAPVKHVVFVTGDEEYRSEESMPMLADILRRDYGYETSVAYAVGPDGFVDPNASDNIVGLDALREADLMVLFTRFRALPDSQLQYILDYVDGGGPVAGFRTATHAFRYEDDPAKAYLNEEWPAELFGQHWITHHGHFDDGADPLTDVALVDERTDHPVLRGVEPFAAYSWLYHVDGGAHALRGDAEPLLTGTALRSNHEAEGRLDDFPLTNPVAWTKTHAGASGTPARVFFTTLGHPYDFRLPAMRRLALNGILWALGDEDRIPPEGARADVAGPYEPNNSGFGDRFKKGLRPDAR